MVPKSCQCLLLLLCITAFTVLAFLCSNVNSQCQINGFKGQCFRRGQDDGYENWCYQYASTAMNYSHMKPKVVFVANSTEDVQVAIRYARDKHVNIAVRSGGHQYSGASSTSGENVQLDVSRAFLDFAVKQDQKNGVTARVGVSLKLIDLYKKLKDNKLYIPGGVCINVHVGGHVQSGGYGVAIRAFGLFADHVLAIEIVTADGKVQTVERESADQKEQDLYYAILGGSMGNWGVLTHIIIQPLQDKDHPNSRAFRGTYNYTKQAAENIIALLPPLADRERDYDMMITVVSGNKTFPIPDWPVTFRLPPVIQVYAQWSNIGGPTQQFDDKAAAWFRSIEAAMASGGADPFPFPDPQAMDWKNPTPLSNTSLNWAFPSIREYAMPYEKRLYLSNWNSNELEQRNWAPWLAGRLDAFIVERQKDKDNPVGTIEMFSQLANAGGPKSQFNQNGKRTDRWGRPLTSIAWRDQTCGSTFDAFFNNSARGDAQQFVSDWHDRTIEGAFGPGGHFAEVPKDDAPKLFWESYGDRRFGNVWNQYHSKEAYDRLRAIKSVVDPKPTLFTPNNFSVDVPAGPVDLPPKSPWLPIEAFPITNQLIEESGFAAVDDHFVEWLWWQWNAESKSTAAGIKSSGGGGGRAPAPAGGRAPAPAGGRGSNATPKRGGGGGGNNRTPKRA